MKIYDWSEDKLRAAVADSINYNDVLRALGIPTSGNNTTTLKRRIKLFDIDISHFTFSPPRRGYKRPLKYYLTNGSCGNWAALKSRLIKEGFKTNVCEVCGLSEWNGNPLTMQMHHKDGNKKNNSLDNLMMICPNCHAQTDNYRGAANRAISKPIRCCQDCGRTISRDSIRCPSCAAKKRLGANVKISLTIEEYKKYKRKGYSNTQIARIYGVSEATIRKWRKNRNL